ncbi:Predicted Zn-dependent peptidase [Gulbenkiania indica]|uniref:Predicted Zn-dependent peptidase n=1 Tax=Gulbenkiania indica TaxID=375574 RepID=A0A0K6GZD9_9NEIS|nr:pitrilysin family protein [Gulbenkiania indica]CUA83893.1 Predicted Zn-dependent peptidase [Gulbenkiania indica]
MHRLALPAVALFLGLARPVLANPYEAVLDNGMKVIVKEDHRAPVAVSQLWYRVGSVDEVNGRTGLSHLLEHMMFKGTQKVPAGEFSRLIAAAGGKDNAFTSRDHTVYFQQLAADRLPLALQLESDRMANLAFKDEAFNSELNVVKEERRWRTDDQPAGRLYEALYAGAFIASPVRTPVIGWMGDLDSMKPDDLRAWYRQWYVPNNATLVVVGDVKAEEVLAQARAAFGGLAGRTLPERRPQPEPPQNGIRRLSVKAPSELPYLALAWKAPRLERIDQSEPYAYAMLASLLDGLDASRLPRRLVREQAVATSVSASYDMLTRAGALFTVIGVPAQGVAPARLEKAIRAELDRIAREGVSAAELERVRRQVEAARIYEKDSMFAQAMQIGTVESLGFSWRDEPEFVQRLTAVTSQQVQAVARGLKDDDLTVVTLVPQPLPKGAPKSMPMEGGDSHGVR